MRRSATYWTQSRSSRPEVFCKKGALKNFTKFIGKHLRQSLFFNEVEGLRHSEYNYIVKLIMHLKTGWLQAFCPLKSKIDKNFKIYKMLTK